MHVMDGEQAAQVGGWRVGRTGGAAGGAMAGAERPCSCRAWEEGGGGRRKKREGGEKEKRKRKKEKKKRKGREGKRELPARFAAAVGHARAATLGRSTTCARNEKKRDGTGIGTGVGT